MENFLNTNCPFNCVIIQDYLSNSNTKKDERSLKEWLDMERNHLAYCLLCINNPNNPDIPNYMKSVPELKG